MKPRGSALGNSRAHCLFLTLEDLLSTKDGLLNTKYGLCSNFLTKCFILFCYWSQGSGFGQGQVLVCDQTEASLCDQGPGSAQQAQDLVWDRKTEWATEE